MKLMFSFADITSDRRISESKSYELISVSKVRILRNNQIKKLLILFIIIWIHADIYSIFYFFIKVKDGF